MRKECQLRDDCKPRINNVGLAAWLESIIVGSGANGMKLAFERML
jgi:hypothetical protein